MIPRLALILMLFGLTACQTATTTDPEPVDAGPPSPEHLADFLVGPPTEPTPMAEDVIYSPLFQGTWVYRHVDPKRDGETIEQVLNPAVEDEQANWRRFDGSSEQIRRLGGDGDGQVYMYAVEDLKRMGGVVSLFATKLPVMVRDIQPNTPITATTDVTVVLRRNPESQIDSGTATITLTHIADQKVAVPAGEFDTKLIRLEFDSAFGFASVTSTSLLYYAEGVGMVAEDYQEDGRAAIFPWTKTRSLVLESYPTP